MAHASSIGRWAIRLEASISWAMARQVSAAVPLHGPQPGLPPQHHGAENPMNAGLHITRRCMIPRLPAYLEHTTAEY